VNDFSMAGLMARATLDANSRNVFAKVRTTSGYRMTYRPTTGGQSTGTGSGNVAFPNGWVRLVRQGNTFISYGSSNGTTWTVIGQTTMSLPSTLYVGMAVSSRQNGAATTAQFRDLSMA